MTPLSFAALIWAKPTIEAELDAAMLEDGTRLRVGAPPLGATRSTLLRGLLRALDAGLPPQLALSLRVDAQTLCDELLGAGAEAAEREEGHLVHPTAVALSDDAEWRCFVEVLRHGAAADAVVVAQLQHCRG